MNYIRENKELLFKYLLIIISNIIICIFTNFYLKNYIYKDLVMLLVTVVINTLIYYYRGTKVFKVYFDFVTNFIVGLILMFYTKDMLIYGTILFSLFFSNNIVFVKSRLSEKYIIKTLQYLMILIYTIISMFINLLIFNII